MGGSDIWLYTGLCSVGNSFCCFIVCFDDTVIDSGKVVLILSLKKIIPVGGLRCTGGARLLQQITISFGSRVLFRVSPCTAFITFFKSDKQEYNQFSGVRLDCKNGVIFRFGFYVIFAIAKFFLKKVRF